MNETFVGLYDIRLATAEDTNFILATFLQGLYYGDSWFSIIPKSIFMANYKKVAQTLVTPGKTAIYVACLPDDPDTIIGYSILSNNLQTVHWVHVKKNWRKRGVARSLIPQAPTACTHLNSVGRSLMLKFPGIIFDPFRL
jgi:hypothetical protein